mmetsp:Transcript_57736/g.159664  ORF Transcript_57736/g.159664 Transcript_57736/m.159664 type:complete len:225 (-) Transcript_57736:251-925(-)
MAGSEKVTKPKPLERPVLGSVRTSESITRPNCEKCDRSLSASVACAKWPTKSVQSRCSSLRWLLRAGPELRWALLGPAPSPALADMPRNSAHSANHGVSESACTVPFSSSSTESNCSRDPPKVTSWWLSTTSLAMSTSAPVESRRARTRSPLEPMMAPAAALESAHLKMIFPAPSMKSPTLRPLTDVRSSSARTMTWSSRAASASSTRRGSGACTVKIRSRVSG